MRNWTYNELENKVENDLDLQHDTIIGPAEMLGYCNEAIDEAEAEIHRLGLEDEYFLQKAPLLLTVNSSEVDLPTDVYANKIKSLVFNDGTWIYELKRLHRHERFVEIELVNNNGGQLEEYKYLIQNKSAPVALDATTGRKILLFPAARETTLTAAEIAAAVKPTPAKPSIIAWYIRNANQVVLPTDVLDIPEFANFIISFMKVRCLGKEGDPRYQDEVAVLQSQRKLMVDTLTDMVPDDEAGSLEADLTHYQEHN